MDGWHRIGVSGSHVISRMHHPRASLGQNALEQDRLVPEADGGVLPSAGSNRGI